MASVNRYLAHRLAKWFGHCWREAGVTGAGIVLRDRKSQTNIGWQALTSAPVIRRGFLFDAVEFAFEGRRHKVGWLAKGSAKALKAEAESGWYGYHADSARQSVERIQRYLNQCGYLRTRQWQQVRKMARQAFSAVKKPPAPGVVADEIRTPYLQLARWARWDAETVQPLREQYIAEQKRQYQALFDSVESNPLTDRQCAACIVDDDNNLVLAGAGTGKTSTLIGRAAYLIESGQAKPDEILMLAFGSKAAQEMRERLAQRLNGHDAVGKGIYAKTFHALGQQIIARVDGGKAQITPFAEDDKLLAGQVDSWFQQLLEQSEYRALAISYFARYLFPEKNPFNFKTQGEYFDYLAANEIRTLKGEQVKSFEECLIANWLFRMGVEYKYELPYQEARTRSLDFRTYQPDFYLPDYGIYIEHVGIDRDGNTAPYIDRNAYHAGMAWKRELHRSNRTTLIETFHYEQRERCLLENLQARLEAQGVELEPLPDKAVLETLREFGAVSKFSGLLSQLLGRFKANCFDQQRLQQQIDSSPEPEQVAVAMELLKPIYHQYQNLLHYREEIDFGDMIGRAIEYVGDGRFKPHWRFILVDEFQDISEPRARLVKALRDGRDDCSLFCVGDDWQAIYRFTGSDVSLTTQFEQYFGPTAITALDKTFRFNNSICDVASRFVTRNPAQVKKQLATHLQVRQPAVSLLRQSKDINNPFKPIHDILKAIQNQAEPGSSVYLLARFWYQLPDRAGINRLNGAYPSLNIEALSFHASKGKEADYVVIIGLDSGKQGFPTEKVTHPLMEALLPKEEPFEHAEERRLFYVALTRAKHRAYLACDMATASRFVVELIEEDYPIELEEFETSLMQQLFEAIRCVRCETGSLVPRQSKHGRFFGCSNYPVCNHAEKGCQQCGQAMKREGRFKRCLDDACGHWAPVCPECGAEMVLRKGPRGEFWGCKNYRGNEQQSCGHTENCIEAPVSASLEAD